MVKIVKTIEREVKKFMNNFLFIIIFSAIYGFLTYFIDVYLLGGSVAIGLMLFIPAIVAISLSSFIGGFIAGLGIIIYMLLKIILNNVPYQSDYLITIFIAYLLGGYFTGILGYRISEMLEREIFEKQLVFNYFRNFVSASLGFGALTGLIIGLYKIYLENEPIIDSINLIGEIFFKTTIALSLILVAQPIIAYLDKREEIKRMSEIERMKKVVVVKKPEKLPIEILESEIGDLGAIEKEWDIVYLKVKNLLDKPMKYRLELEGPDIIEPNEIYTKKIEPKGIDVVTFSIYPLDGGERHFKAKIMPVVDKLDDYTKYIKEFGKSELTLAYFPKDISESKITALNTFLGTLAVIGLLIKGLYDIITVKGKVTGFSVATAFFAIEVVILLIWYFYKKQKLEKELRELM